MAQIYHQATISPTKPELLAAWVPSQPWGEPDFEPVGSYRFDDPDDAVGVETMLLRCPDGHLLQVPLTFRDAPLPGGEDALLTRMQHSVLGERFVYDGTADPTYLRTLAAVLLDGAVQAEEYLVTEGVVREPKVRVSSTGSSLRDAPPIVTVVASSDPADTVVESGDLRVVVRRRLDLPAPDVASEPALIGTWAGQDEPVLLAYVG